MSERKHLNIVIQILRIFQSARAAQTGITRHQLIALLRDPRYRPNVDRAWWYRFDREPDATVQSILQSLAGLGLVRQAWDHSASSGFELWYVADTWSPPPPGDRDNGGNGRPTGPGTDGPDDDDGGGGGLREALRHPVLFALPAEDFDALADNLFTKGQA